MALKPLKPVKTLDGFLPIGGGSPGGGFGGGPVIGYNPSAPTITIGGGSGGSTKPGTATNASLLSGATSLIGCFTSPLDCLLRLAFFLLGLIAIIGAIYLYKPSIVTTPLNAAKNTALATGA